MIEIKDKTMCSGCTACYSVCSKDAIQMLPDEEGFLYPIVNSDLCVQCGLCNKVCPIENKLHMDKHVVKSVVLRTKNTDVLKNSTSGGFITPLASYVLETNGIVCAATYDSQFRIKHTILEKSTGFDCLNNIRGSKYVQSNMGECFRNVENNLKQGRVVLFVGTTCQVYGLKAFLRKHYDRLITVDLVCHGTPSPKLWDKYLRYQKDKYKSEIRHISFRNKTYGYHSGTMKIEFENGKTYYGSGRVDYMLKSFYSEIASRPICYQCPFKVLNRCSDFTIYDCWSAGKLVNNLKDDDKGYTNVIIQSSTGEKILDKISKQYEIYSTETGKAIEMDGSMILKSAIPHKLRSEYYKELDNESLKCHIQRFIPITFKDYLIEGLKKFVYRTGGYSFLKKIIKG